MLVYGTSYRVSLLFWNDDLNAKVGTIIIYSVIARSICFWISDTIWILYRITVCIAFTKLLCLSVIEIRLLIVFSDKKFDELLLFCMKKMWVDIFSHEKVTIITFSYKKMSKYYFFLKGYKSLFFGTHSFIWYCYINFFKGAVSRDFRPLYFFINRTHLGPW